MTKKEIISILESYTFATRGINTLYGSCVYYDPVTGNRCIIGALLPLEDAKYLASNAFPAIHDITKYANIPESLADLIREHGVEFLEDVQTIHDDSSNWMDSGLTEKGQKEINDLKTEWGL